MIGNKFEKVSFNQYANDWKEVYGEARPDLKLLKEMYENIQMPKRTTDGSAGYDFYIPFGFTLEKGKSIVIPTGLRCKMRKRNVLLILPRSGHGFKYRISIVNTTGVIDSDYYHADNEGHIKIKISYDGINSATKLRLDEIHIKDDCPYLRSFVETCESPDTITFNNKNGIAQGIITSYSVTSDDKKISKKIRVGGFGSTDTK